MSVSFKLVDVKILLCLLLVVKVQLMRRRRFLGGGRLSVLSEKKPTSGIRSGYLMADL
jgi:uncharacterized protein (TIGR03382 family)